MRRQGPASVGPCLVVVVACVLLALSACSATEPAPATRSANPSPPAATSLPSTAWTKATPRQVNDGGTLRLAIEAIPANFNPYVSTSGDPGNQTIKDVLAPTVGSAIRIKADGTWQVDPDYAVAVKPRRGDKLVVDVTLNEHAVWSDGTPIVAADMIAWWRAMNGSSESFDVPSSAGFDDIATVEQGASRFDYTVTFARRITDWPLYVYPGLPAAMTGSAKVFNTAAKDTPPPSNGPFVISKVDRAAGVITQTPNPHWWGTHPKLHTIRFSVIDPTRQAPAFAAGRIDALDLGGNAPAYDIAAKRSDARIERAAGLGWTQLTINGTRGPLKDVRIRRAIAHAIDRKAISAQVNTPLGAPAQTQGSMIYVRGQKGYRDAATAVIGFDPAKSRRLLSAAGYPKDGKPLTLKITVPVATPASELRAKAIQRDLANVGISITLVRVPRGKFFDDHVVPLDFDLVTFTWHNAIMPVTAAQPLFNPIDSGQNYTGITSPKLGRLWREANAEDDLERRIARAHAIDDELFDYVPMVPIAPVPVVFAVAEKLANFGASQFEHPDFTKVGFTK